MTFSTLPRFARTLVYLAIGVAVLGAIYWLRIWTQPFWDRDAFHWAYTDAAAPTGQRPSLSIKAKTSDMTSITRQPFTPTLSIICDQKYVYVEMETAYPLCIAGCGSGGSYGAFEYFVTDPGSAEQERQRGEWYFTGSNPTRAKRFYEASEDPVFAERDAPSAVAFVRRLAASKEYWVDLGSGRSVYNMADLASQLPRLAPLCPSLR